jgi:microcin-processing metallopeptidase PmbA/TldD-like protein
MEDLDPASAARDAVHRALPRRRPAEPRKSAGLARTGAADGGPARGSPPRPRLVLEPRAAATLLAALGPWVAAGALSTARPSALSIVDDPLARGRPGSAPFDGEGRAARKRVLLDRGRAIERISPETGSWQRLSYRDLPAAAPVALAIVPGRRREPGQREKPATGKPAVGGPPAPPTIRAAAIEIRSGTSLWSLSVRRGDWMTGEPADGWSWEGPALALVQAVVETGDDLRWYQVGMEVGAPTVVLDGLAPWIDPAGGTA